jgi:hypothetical protein
MSVSDLVVRFAAWLGDLFGGVPDAFVALSGMLLQGNRGLLIIFLLLALLLYRLLRRER